MDLSDGDFRTVSCLDQDTLTARHRAGLRPDVLVTAGAPPLVFHPIVEAPRLVPIADSPMGKRVTLISGTCDKVLPAETVMAIVEIQRLSTVYAQNLRALLEGCNKVDTGRCIAALDHVQQAKNIAIDAVKLPNLPAYNEPRF